MCGNGGSAADSIHIAAEFTGRFQRERKSLPAISLAADIAAVTAIGNDYGFEFIFERQLEGIAERGDVLIAISTSGNSENVVNAAKLANKLGIITIGMTGSASSQLQSVCEVVIQVPSRDTARIQEVQKFLLHFICDYVEYNVNVP